MTRIFGEFAYSDGPRRGCWWDHTVHPISFPVLRGAQMADVLVVGAGFTGLNAALELAQSGFDVVVVDARQPGWGASGRNGGFCCLGGGRAGDAALDKRFGIEARREWHRTEIDAVRHVERLIARFDWDVDRHSNGETLLAHTPRAMREIEQSADRIAENYGVEPILLARAALRQSGMNAGFHGAMTIPIGFGLNPAKYLQGLVSSCVSAGVRMFGDSPVRLDAGGNAVTAKGSIRAERTLMATNGYSSEDTPKELAGRYMPAQSTVLVTRPLTQSELSAQGWTTEQMSYDSRHLLHYFRLMPDRRFLFGMRGGLFASPASERRARQAVQRDFARMFPAWAEVDIDASWSGFVCLSRDGMPYVGPLDQSGRILAGLSYHGNGVAMGSYTGWLLAKAVQGKAEEIPEVLQRPLRKFPFGRYRRLVMPAAYAAMKLADFS